MTAAEALALTVSSADDEMPLERLEAEICSLAGQLAAGTCRYLVLLADFDTREGWRGWNVRSCAHWLSWRCGVDLRTAREHLRVARRLVELPYLCEKFSGGQLSYSKARAIARVATGRNEVALVDSALCATAAQIERLTRGMRQAGRSGSATDREARSDRLGIRWRWDEDGSLVLWGRLDSVDGARVLAASVRAEAERRRTEHEGPAEPSVSSALTPPSDLAPALAAMAEVVCAMDSAPVHSPAAEVWVHVDTSGAIGELSARIDDGPALSISDVERIGCAAWIRRAGHARDGRTIDLGRRNRRPSGRLLAVLHRRDRGCAAPGCGRTRFLHAHHVQTWASGGGTSPDNMMMLCGEHHRSVHHGGFSIIALGRQRFVFRGPDGARTPAAPAVEGTLGLRRATPGVSPDAIAPNWNGQHLDLDWRSPASCNDGRGHSGART